ncbi:MAG TPA: hypothetical protein VFW42_02360 [Fluviicoccus sp.]|nr:hypothetical protein [Fluviicoccus sp.]
MIQDNMDELLTGLRNIFARKMRVIDQMPTLAGKELVTRFQMEAPALYVAPIGGSSDGDANDLNFGILAVTKNAQSSTASRAGDGIEIGLHKTMDVVMQITGGWLDGWRWISFDFPDDAAFNRAGLDVGLVRVATRCTNPASDELLAFPADSLPDLLGLTAYFDVEPFASAEDHRAWLDGEETPTAPDAVATVNLEAP